MKTYYKVLVVATLALVLSAVVYKRLTTISPQDTTVMITNLSENSGGSGSIVFVSKTVSAVLTNGHVCEVVKEGGYVHTDKDKHLVSSYQVSRIHDLCLVYVSADLHKAAKLSAFVPAPFDEATTSGHPKLAPTIVSKGHFSFKRVISVLTGTRPCTEAEQQSEDTVLFCAFLGGVPIVKTYESVVVSTLVQPGSSGSAVYDLNGNISAVIFASSGDLSYGYAVPYEYVYRFLILEQPNLSFQYPNAEITIMANRSLLEVRNALHTLCKTPSNTFEKNVCSSLNISDLIERR